MHTLHQTLHIKLIKMTASSLMLFLACISFSFSANILPFSTAQTSLQEPVFDTAGQALRRGLSYYILPAQLGDGGGLTLVTGRNGSCPLEIVLSPNNSANGLPLRFSPFNNDSIIRTNTDHNIRFIVSSPPAVCPQSYVWQLLADQGSVPPLFVTTGGVEGNHGLETLANWFKIQNMKMRIKSNLALASLVSWFSPYNSLWKYWYFC